MSNVADDNWQPIIVGTLTWEHLGALVQQMRGRFEIDVLEVHTSGCRVRVDGDHEAWSFVRETLPGGA